MHTKLKRIEEIMKAKITYSELDYASLQKDLEDQFGELKDENTILRERVRKLKIIHNGISNGKGSKPKT